MQKKLNRALLIIFICIVFLLIFFQYFGSNVEEISMYDLYQDMQDSSLKVQAVKMNVDELKPKCVIYFVENEKGHFGYFQYLNGTSIIVKSLRENKERKIPKSTYKGYALTLNFSISTDHEFNINELKNLKGEL